MKIVIADKEVELTSIISIATVAVVALGYYDLYFYYIQFGIPITSLLETTEIIFAFTSIFVSLIGFLIFALILFIAAQILKKGNRKPWYLVLPVTIGVLQFAFHENSVSNGFQIFDIFLFLLVIFFIMPNDKLKIKWFLVVVVFIIFLQIKSLSISLSIINKQQGQYNAEVQLSDVTIKSNHSFIYVGSTKQYIFFWDANLHKAIAYPLTDINSISISKNRNFSSWPF